LEAAAPLFGEGYHTPGCDARKAGRGVDEMLDNPLLIKYIYDH
jgi:hypothetical protein